MSSESNSAPAGPDGGASIRGPGLRGEQKLRTREKLLDSARALFARQGYAAVRVDDIAAAVGCSRATFYLHFTGKPEVLRAVAARTTVPTVAELSADLDRVLLTGSRAEFGAWVARAMAAFDDHRDLLPAWEEAMALDRGFRELARAGLRALPATLPGYLARWPEQRRAEAVLRVELFVAQVERFFTREAERRDGEVSAERLAEVLTDIWYPALRAPSGDG